MRLAHVSEEKDSPQISSKKLAYCKLEPQSHMIMTISRIFYQKFDWLRVLSRLFGHFTINGCDYEWMWLAQFDGKMIREMCYIVWFVDNGSTDLRDEENN